LAPAEEGDSDPATFKVLPTSPLQRWQGRPIEGLTKADIIRELDRVVDRGSPIAANRTLSAIRRFLNWSVERGLIEVSPAASVKPPAPESSRDRVLSDREIIWLWSAAQQVGYPFGTIVQLLLVTAQRRDEVTGMRRAELDGASQWVIPASRAKNDTIHVVPLSALALEVLGQVPEGRPDLLFTTTGNSQVSGFSRAKRAIDSAMTTIARKELREPKFEIVPWKLHDLRRTAATGMAGLQTPVHVVERLLNHRTGTIRGVAAVYNRHEYWTERVDAMAAWSASLRGLLKAIAK
jgi:integrase